jgi:beta-glucosidase
MKFSMGVSLAAVLVVALSACAPTGPPPDPPPPSSPYLDPALPPAVRAQDLLARLTTDEKFGQMTLVERASVSPNDVRTQTYGGVFSAVSYNPNPNTPTNWADTSDAFQQQAVASRTRIPILFGVDGVHGQGAVFGSTVFPHNIGLGATRDPALVQQVGRAAAEEISATGVSLTFAPCLCVARNDRWGRTYESFGETPELVSSMATIVTGLQGSDVGTGQPSVLATAKHYIADGGTAGGSDRGDAQISEAELRAIHLPPFREAINRGVGSIMISYSSWNGVKMHANRYLITDVLKNELGFDGIVMSDYAGVDGIDGAPLFSAQEVATAINAGIDMMTGPYSPPLFKEYLRQGVANGTIPMSRIDDAVRRIITKKFELGLFEAPLTDRSLLGTVGSGAHRTLARQAVRESQVLLKNANDVLPLSKSAKVFVAGKSADNIGYQSGGWTIGWQGGSGPITTGTTVLQGVRQTVSNPANVTYERYGAGINSTYDAVIAVVGETPYAEYLGDRSGSMTLDAEDLWTLFRLESSGVPVIVVLVSGRPLNVTAELGDWDALVAAWLPGTEGGGVADVLFGDFAPTGKLPVSWMASESQQPINAGDGKIPLFPFGFGLTY